MESYGKMINRGRGGAALQRGARSSPQPIQSTKYVERSPYPPLGLEGGGTSEQEPLKSSGAKRLMQLEAQLRLDRQAAQFRAIAEFASLFDAYPSPVLINSGILKLADMFHLLGNGARLVICQTFKESRNHLKQLLNKDQVVARISEVSKSNDYLARSLCLRTLSTMSEQISDRADIHFLVLSGLNAEEELEVTAALEFAALIVVRSQVFATSLLSRLQTMLARKLHPRIEKLVVTTLETFCSHVDLAHRARRLCLDHLNRTTERIELTLALLETSTALAIADTSAAQDQIDMLFRYMDTRPKAVCALECLVRLAKARHPISITRLEELVQLGPVLRVLMVLKFSRVQLDLDSLQQFPPLPEVDQVLAWIQKGGEEPLPKITAAGPIGFLFNQFRINDAPPFTYTLLAAQIIAANSNGCSAAKYVLKLTALRLWICLAKQTCPRRLNATLSTLAIVVSRLMALMPSSLFDHQLMLATLRLNIGSEPSPSTEMLGRWILVYCTTYLTASPNEEVISLDGFTNDPHLLPWAVCLQLHFTAPSQHAFFTKLLDGIPLELQATPSFAVALAEMAFCAHRTNHYRVAESIFPKLSAKVSSDVTNSFLLGLHAWSKGEASLASHIQAINSFPDPAWVSYLSEIIRSFYRSATYFQAWSASEAKSSPFSVWWLQIRAESLSQIRNLLMILISLPKRMTPFYLTQLKNLMLNLENLRHKVGYLVRRFYGLDSMTRNAVRDCRLQLAILSFAVGRLFKLGGSDQYPELSSVQAMPKKQKSKTCNLALEVMRSLPSGEASEAAYLWQLIHQLFIEAFPSPTAIFNPREVVSIKLTMDPCYTGKPLLILRDTVLRFSGVVRLHHLMHPPSRLRLTLGASSDPVVDLPSNLDAQVLGTNVESSIDAWVTEVPLQANDMNFQVTVSIPLSFYAKAHDFICVSCSLFNPALNDYCCVGPKFSFPIVLKPNMPDYGKH
ncbi:Integrator complex subunit 7 [Entomophthora muscae]|uniref:Integrator complex subunit 7 n=1 Tax=Entomophthora muscae TaxID=34485 RepID=A0ACC2U768_9FUNG|nr:Integrator complex subunit 7 [Entomophthora muscae]